MAKSVNGNNGANGNGQAAADNNDQSDQDATTPICRCRVLYLGSAVPHITKDGLQGIQEPLRDLYPEQGVFWNTDRDHNATGIDSWLSVWSNGILVENVDDKGNTIRRFHPIESLHYCAAVRYVSVPAAGGGDPTKNGSSTHNDPHGIKVAKFLPLDSPFSKSTLIDAMKQQQQSHPPLFACILRRTSGIKVLECHAFICKKEAAANALVRCCFHAYADTMHAKQIELESPYEQLDKRRSRSIGSALDSQSLIEDKVNTWQKNSTGGGGSSSGGGTPDDPAGNGFAMDTRSISRQQKQTRTPSMVSLISHSMADGPPMGGHHHNHHGLPGPNMVEPIYYNNNPAIPPTGTLRSVRSFISLAALKSHNSKKSRPPRQMPIPLAPAVGTMPPMHAPAHGPPPVMFATLTKKELKKVLKKESTLKRKHKYKDFPLPFMAPNGYPFMYGPPMPAPPAPAAAIHHGGHHPIHPIYAPMPPPMAPPPPPHAPMAMPPTQFYGTIDSRKGRIPLPPPTMIENGLPHYLPPTDEPIYMPAVPSPNGTLRPITPHMDPIYLDGRGQPTPMPMIGGPGGGGPPPQMYMPNPQMPGSLMPCTFVSTLSRKELKELEKQKAAMKKAAKKEKKKSSKKGATQMMANGQPLPPGPLGPPNQHQHQHQQQMMMEEPPMDFYQPRPPYGYPPDDMVHIDPDESMMSPSEVQLSSGNYSNASTAGGAGGGGGGGIYKKKGHLNERAFSYSIRQEHRSRSNSLSNLAFENGMPPPPPPTTANSGQNGSRNGENGSHNNSSISLKSSEAAANQQNINNNKSMMMNGGGPMSQQQHQQQYEHVNGNGGGGRMMMMMNGHGHGHHPHHPHHGVGVEGPIDPNQLASRMSNLSLKNGYGPNNPPPPPPPLPPNGYHYHQRTATIKRL